MIQTSRTYDPLRLARALWPEVRFYREQQEILRSVWENDETYVYAGNMLGKDFVFGRGVVLFFLTRHPCRIITTSTKDAHLAVLWGEIHKAIQESVVPLSVKQNGNLIVNQRELKKVVDGTECPLSYVRGMVANDDTMESFQGHHIADTGDGIPRTAIFGDEASSLRNGIHKMTTSWARRGGWFGNTWPCENFYKWALKGRPGTKDRGGDIPRPDGNGFYRRCFQMPAEVSPNIRLARIQLAKGLEPTGEVIIPGVKPWNEYVKNRELWDPIQQQVSLDAEFPEDEHVKMFPPEWIDRAEELAKQGGYGTQAESAGVDSAQGGDNSSFAAANRKALLALDGLKTPDTTHIVDRTVELLRRYPLLRPERIYFDQGGGGYQHACVLRQHGYDVRTVYFGAAATPEPEPGVVTLDERISHGERRSAYKNKRSELYGIFRKYLNPAEGYNFALPGEVLNRPRADGGPSLREQMQAVPLDYNEEGQICIRPKTRRDEKDKRETLTELVGCSPDELDAVALAVYGLESEDRWSTVGVGY